MNWLDRSVELLGRLPIRDRDSHRSTAFSLYPSQARRQAIIEKQWEEQGYVRIIDLKARRVGFSAHTEGLFWCRGLAYPAQNMKILAHLTGSAEELFRVPQDLSRGFPGFPATDIQQKKIYFRHPTGDSTLSIGTAGTPSSGRGGTLAFLHLSEAAKYLDPEIFVAMISSVLKGPGSMIVIESTANGREGPGEAFFNYWEDAVAGKNGYVPNFASWLEDPAFIRPEEEAEDAPADDLEKELMGAPFNASRQQIAWMRRTKADDCRNIEAKFLEDFPHCPEVAFQVSGSPAFPREEIAYAESTIKDPMASGKFVREAGSFKFRRDDNGPWRIWKFPFDKNGKADGLHYYIGADAALGEEDRDFTAACVLCGETGELAARIAETCPPEELANQLDMAGRFFSLAMVNIELTGNLGRWTLIKLRDMFHYPNIYRWKGKDDKRRGAPKSMSLAFEMTNATRRLIIDAARYGLRMGLNNEAGGLQVNDRALMQQIGLCTLVEWRWEVKRGHDDILVAWMIGVLTREQYPPPRMSFAPKNVMEQNSPLGLMEQTGLKLQKSELDSMFHKEMRQVMAQAGLRKDMRGSGRRHVDRLFGI